MERVAAHAERDRGELEAALKAGTYRPPGVRRASLAKSDGGGRPLGLPAVKDRIVQGARKGVLEPIFEGAFREPSSGVRPGRSAKEALRVVDGLRQDGSTWVVDADLKSSFDSIPQAGLLAAVSERSSEGRVRGLSERSLGQELCDGRARWTPTQGAVLSPLLANR